MLALGACTHGDLKNISIATTRDSEGLKRHFKESSDEPKKFDSCEFTTQYVSGPPASIEEALNKALNSAEFPTVIKDVEISYKSYFYLFAIDTCYHVSARTGVLK